MPSELLSEHRDAALVLTISDATSRNALSEAVITAGIEALDSAESDPQVRCVVLQGAGGQFCAGGHLQGLMARRAAGPAAQTHMLELLHQWIEALRVFPKPVLAAPAFRSRSPATWSSRPRTHGSSFRTGASACHPTAARHGA